MGQLAVVQTKTSTWIDTAALDAYRDRAEAALAIADDAERLAACHEVLLGRGAVWQSLKLTPAGRRAENMGESIGMCATGFLVIGVPTLCCLPLFLPLVPVVTALGMGAAGVVASGFVMRKGYGISGRASDVQEGQYDVHREITNKLTAECEKLERNLPLEDAANSAQFEKLMTLSPGLKQRFQDFATLGPVRKALQTGAVSSSLLQISKKPNPPAA